MKRVLTPDYPERCDSEGADYTLNAEADCWITYKGVTIHIFTPFNRPDLVTIATFPSNDLEDPRMAMTVTVPE